MPSDAPLPPLRQHRIALVMIARDEATQIEAALASARPWVDDMLVLDTGSTDSTVARARAAGARVAELPWPNDFSAARNAALNLAGADWHLVLDADERIASGGDCLAALRHTSPDWVGQVRVDSDFEQAGQPAMASSWISRVLPGPLRYAGRVHEQVDHTLPLRQLPLVIRHSGYQTQALAAKAGRNAALLDAALRDEPGNAYLWYQRGKDHDVYGQWDQALACFERAEQALADQGTGPSWLHDLDVRSLHALKCCGQHAQALARAEAQLQRWSESPDFFFALGDVLLDWAADQPEHADTLVPMIESAWQRCLLIGERPELEGAVHGRGSHLARHNLDLLHQCLNRPSAAATGAP